MTISSIYRKNLSELLKAKGMTQGELARQAGWSRQFTSQLVNSERGITLATLERTANVFNVPCWALLREGYDLSDAPEIPEIADILAQASAVERDMVLRVCKGIVRQTNSED